MNNAACVFPGAGPEVIFAGSSNRVEVWDRVESRRTDVFEREPSPPRGQPGSAATAQAALALSADGAQVARATPRISIWNVPDRRWRVSLPPERSRVFSLAWTPDGRLLAVGSADGSLVLWDLPVVRRELAEIGLAW